VLLVIALWHPRTHAAITLYTRSVLWLSLHCGCQPSRCPPSQCASCGIPQTASFAESAAADCQLFAESCAALRLFSLRSYVLPFLRQHEATIDRLYLENRARVADVVSSYANQ
jgi:hypothetical protein